MEKRGRMASTGSTSSSGTAGPAGLKRNSPRSVARRRLWSSTSRVYSLKMLVLAGARGVLQLEHRVGVEEVDLAVAPPLVLAAALELGRTGRPRPERAARGAAALPPRSAVRPTPPIRDDVDGEVGFSTKAWSRPTASKICAPQ